jgi:hypothetical protein
MLVGVKDYDCANGTGGSDAAISCTTDSVSDKLTVHSPPRLPRYIAGPLTHPPASQCPVLSANMPVTKS